MSRSKPGRTRMTLAGLLASQGVTADAVDLWGQEGTNRRVDGARWGCYAAKWAIGADPTGRPWPRPFNLFSWDTMTDCVKHGIVIGHPGQDGSVEVHSRRR